MMCYFCDRNEAAGWVMSENAGKYPHVLGFCRECYRANDELHVLLDRPSPEVVP